MAPILSLSKGDLDHIRDSITLSVVSIWQIDSSNCKKNFRSGFIYDCSGNNCTIVTLAKGLKEDENFFVQFENGECFEVFATLGDKNSKLVALFVTGLKFEPKKVKFSAQKAVQCEEVVHMGNFDEEHAKFNFSTGSVGLVGHNPSLVNRRKGENVTMFTHCCSGRLHLIGGPVFNLQSEVVGLNYAQKEKKNLFFALDLAQLKSELNKLIDGKMEQMINLAMKEPLVTNRKRKAGVGPSQHV